MPCTGTSRGACAQGGELLLQSPPASRAPAVDAAPGLLDLKVGGPAEAGAVLGGALARPRQVRVGVDEAGHHGGALDVDDARVVGDFEGGGDLGLRTGPDRRGRLALRRRRARSRRGRRSRPAGGRSLPGAGDHRSRLRSRRAPGGRSGCSSTASLDAAGSSTLRTIAAKRPAATASVAASSSGARYRSRSSVGANSRITARPAPVPGPGSSGARRWMPAPRRRLRWPAPSARCRGRPAP